MRYEVTQEQWRDFFNTLPTTGTARSDRDVTSASNGGKGSDTLVNRNNLSWDSSTPSSNTTTPDRSSPNGETYCNVSINYLSWADTLAYLDWAALRPMSELEYEKACRGTTTPISGEFAWGSTNYSVASGFSNSGRVNEVPSNSGANVAIGSGPYRVGAFSSLNYGAASRELSGGTFYGAMEMSGNLREPVVSVGNSIGRAYTGEHGDGVLDSAGAANVTNWPSAAGSGSRGGAFDGTTSLAYISDRSEAGSGGSARAVGNGARGVRTAP